ncbi:iron-sulfur cluster assembly accessory protein [Brevundimonas sp.]|uniref:HesB/IscA family protein n=1 Tax=Brevundimonas sp. TaxID=1871086 RepID=UPI002ABC7CF9|nr:iron-sulfur cluster assembly accessory protein [Brevundimonas sp.]MDZ4364760.1 iron-sulfur cluster assembly accessory protein [Brevundimonas sp.]
MGTVQSTDFRIDAAPRNGHGLSLSASAAKRLATLSDLEGHPVLLRVAVDGGGCSGFQYRFELIQQPEPDDLTILTDGQAAAIDPVSLPFLKGSEIAWVDDLAGAQFVVRNPNAASSCGCGVSFSI